MAGTYGSDDRKIDLISVFEAVGQVVSGNMDEAELRQMEEVACPGCGSCAGMFTANTMNCMTEVLGLGLPGNGTIPAVDARRRGLARTAGKQIMKVLADDLRPQALINRDSLYNAFTVDMALGASTNSVLHLMAIAHEAGVNYPLPEINEISQNTPSLCKIAPAGPHHMEDLDRAGGIPAVMHELGEKLKLNAKTVTGGTIAENIADRRIKNSDVIRHIDNPYSPTGGLAILFGNLAPGGAVVRRSAVAPDMLVHRGPARVFDSEEAATQAMDERNAHSNLSPERHGD